VLDVIWVRRFFECFPHEVLIVDRVGKLAYNFFWRHIAGTLNSKFGGVIFRRASVRPQRDNPNQNGLEAAYSWTLSSAVPRILAVWH